MSRRSFDRREGGEQEVQTNTRRFGVELFAISKLPHRMQWGEEEMCRERRGTMLVRMICSFVRTGITKVGGIIMGWGGEK